MTKTFCLTLSLLCTLLLCTGTASATEDITTAAKNLVASMSEDQQELAMYDFSSEERLDWHYVPKPDRKGLSLKAINAEQVYLVHILLNESLGRAGYTKTAGIMHLESVLRDLEVSAGRDGALRRRDPAKYFVTFFGMPADSGAWGWSFEGHHVSINFTILDGTVNASTPAFFGASPHRVPTGPMTGRRVLGLEEDHARKLLNSLTNEQLDKAVLDTQPPRNIFTAADQRVLPDAPQGIRLADLTDVQKGYLHELIEVYIDNVAEDAADERRSQVSSAGNNIYFAWMGSGLPGEGHYYRVQAPTFLIEYDNVQSDANHSHTVWRDFDGDFGHDIIGDHRKAFTH